MRSIRAILLSALGLVGCARDATLSKGDFTRFYAAELRKTMPASRVEIKEDMHLEITAAGGQMWNAFLDNCYAEYRSAPRQRDEIVARYINSYSPSRQPKDEVDPNQIIPIIKDRAWLAEIQAGLKARGARELPENVHERLNDELVIVYAVDNPQTLQYLTPASLEGARLPREKLRERAVANLRRILPKASRVSRRLT